MAGVSIQLLLDDNGIIAKSKEAKLNTRISEIETEIGMWKQENFMRKETNQTKVDSDVILQKLKNQKLVTDDEIDQSQELIIIKNKDGAVVKEISYSNVQINVSQSAGTGNALLKVTSVEGILIPIIDIRDENYEELDRYENSLSTEEKKDIIKLSMPNYVNKNYPDSNCTSFEEALPILKANSVIQGEVADESAFWASVKNAGGVDHFFDEQILFGLYCNDETQQISGCEITNPNGEASTEYTATTSGTYAFTVKDKVTGKSYIKKVTVNI